MLGAQAELPVLTAAQKHAARERERRKKKTIAKHGEAWGAGQRPYLNEKEETHLYAMLLDDIVHGIHHPPAWLCEQVFVTNVYCFYIILRR